MKKVAVRVISVILAALVLFFIGRIVGHNWANIRSYQFHFNIPLLFGASGIYALTFFLLSVGWYLTLKYLRNPLSLSYAFLYFCITQPAKYVPGKIWVAVARMKFCKTKGISNSTTALSTAIESVMEFLGGTYVALIAIFNIPIFARFSVAGPLVISAIGVLLMIPQVFYFLINRYFKLFNQEPVHADQRATFLQLILLQVVYCLGMLGMGVSQFLFLRSFVDVPLESASLLISVGSLSYIASMIALFSPSGLGVREGVWYVALKNVVAPSVAIIYAFVSRFWTIIIEAILLFICLPIVLIFDKEKTHVVHKTN